MQFYPHGWRLDSSDLHFNKGPFKQSNLRRFPPILDDPYLRFQ
jgi:hypothetical protein